MEGATDEPVVGDDHDVVKLIDALPDLRELLIDAGESRRELSVPGLQEDGHHLLLHLDSPGRAEAKQDVDGRRLREVAASDHLRLALAEGDLLDRLDEKRLGWVSARGERGDDPVLYGLVDDAGDVAGLGQSGAVGEIEVPHSLSLHAVEAVEVPVVDGRDLSLGRGHGLPLHR